MRMVFIFLLLLALAACRPPNRSDQAAAGTSDTGVRVRLELPETPSVGPAELRVYVLGADNNAVTDAEVTVTGTMTHAGMEPVIVQLSAREDGLYVTESFDFNMAGDWIVTAEVNLQEGRRASDEATVTVAAN